MKRRTLLTFIDTSASLMICWPRSDKADADVKCPVEPGQHTAVQTVELPKEIPPAKFVVMVRGYTVDDGDLMCADIQVDFRKRS